MVLVPFFPLLFSFFIRFNPILEDRRLRETRVFGRIFDIVSHHVALPLFPKGLMEVKTFIKYVLFNPRFYKYVSLNFFIKRKKEQSINKIYIRNISPLRKSLKKQN